MIKIKNLTKKYGNQTVLRNINLIFNKGDIVALAGVNGSGKSTLVNALADVISKDSGSIIIDDIEIGINEYKYRSKIGYVLQTPIYIENLTIREYSVFLTSFYPDKTIEQEHVERVMKLLGLRFEKKIIRDYSKGFKKRISILSALLHQPDILILDEPFDGLDILVLNGIFDYLKEQANNGAAVILVAHDPNHIFELCNRIVILKNKNIVLDARVEKTFTLFEKQLSMM
jgi:ABC-2 type transport system ATP-binding protein